MSDEEFDLDDFDRRMEGALAALKQEFAGLRAGRASASLLEPIVVDAYGSPMPLAQLGSINVPESRLLSVQVWDKSLVGAVEKAIRNSDLGLNPSADGQLIRIPLPELNEERRAELAKVAHKYAEQAKVAVRNVRRDALEKLKKAEKDIPLGQDDVKLYADEVQAMTDRHVGDIDKALEQKEHDIMSV